MLLSIDISTMPWIGPDGMEMHLPSHIQDRLDLLLARHEDEIRNSIDKLYEALVDIMKSALPGHVLLNIITYLVDDEYHDDLLAIVKNRSEHSSLKLTEDQKHAIYDIARASCDPPDIPELTQLLHVLEEDWYRDE